MAIMYVICGLINKSTFSIFGAELLISGSLPLILATISQVFIIGLSQVNLGIGNFMGLVSVIIAAVFYDDPLKGSFMLLGALFLYACMGLLIYFRNIPASYLHHNQTHQLHGCRRQHNILCGISSFLNPF